MTSNIYLEKEKVIDSILERIDSAYIRESTVCLIAIRGLRKLSLQELLSLELVVAYTQQTPK